MVLPGGRASGSGSPRQHLGVAKSCAVAALLALGLGVAWLLGSALLASSVGSSNPLRLPPPPPRGAGGSGTRGFASELANGLHAAFNRLLRKGDAVSATELRGLLARRLDRLVSTLSPADAERLGSVVKGVAFSDAPSAEGGAAGAGSGDASSAAERAALEARIASFGLQARRKQADKAAAEKAAADAAAAERAGADTRSAAPAASRFLQVEADGSEDTGRYPGSRPQRPAGGSEFEDEDRFYTQQTCYVQSDESELCVLDNVMCFDGKSPIVVATDPTTDPDRIDDYSATCMDYRFYEPSALEFDSCSYHYSGRRRYEPNHPDLGRHPSTDHALHLGWRRWGPTSRGGNQFFKEVRPEHVMGRDYHALDIVSRSAWANEYGTLAGASGGYPASTKASRTEKRSSADMNKHFKKPPAKDGKTHGPPAPVDKDAAKVLKTGFVHEDIPGLRVSERLQIGVNRTVDWIEGTLWLVGLDVSSHSNPFHWMSKVGFMFDAQRNNASTGFGSHPLDTYLDGTRGAGGANGPRINRAAWRHGAQWKMPSIDTVVFVGPGAQAISQVSELKEWFQSTLRIATQPQTQAYGYDMVRHLNEDRIVCARRGAVVGSKYRLFTSRGDHALFRSYVYRETGMIAKGRQPHPRFPPRKITIIDREQVIGREIYNKKELTAAVAATGLPYEFVGSLGKKTFAQQLDIMSSTGILIGPHGAALANSMYLPAHAAVVELFPYLMKKWSYSNLASTSGINYYPVYSWGLLPPNRTEYYGVQLMKEDYFISNCLAVNISSYDANIMHACNSASKYYPALVPIPVLTQVLKDAADAIGAFNPANPEWIAAQQAAAAPGGNGDGSSGDGSSGDGSS